MTERIATLWIGKKLSFLELICLKSMECVGQKPILYLYEEIENAPDFVEVRDAREVLHTNEIKDIYGQNHLDDPRLWSDIFRIKLMVRTPYIWADTDAYALQEHKSSNGYLFARKRRGSEGFIPNGILRLAQDSQALRLLDDFISRKGALPPWWDEKQKQDYLSNHTDVSFETLPLGVTGPEALGYFLELTREHSNALAFRVLYPLRARNKKDLLETPRRIGPESFPESMSLHLYATGIRRRLIRSGGIPPAGSLLDYLCAQTGIDAKENPITHRD